MAELTSRQRRRGKEYAEELAGLAARAPDSDTKRRVYAAVSACRRKYGYSPEQKLAELLRVIGLGASSINDLVAETPFPRQEIVDLVKQLEQSRRVRIEYLSVTGGSGRPSMHISPV